MEEPGRSDALARIELIRKLAFSWQKFKKEYWNDGILEFKTKCKFFF
jgi:hypothetical protein